MQSISRKNIFIIIIVLLLVAAVVFAIANIMPKNDDEDINTETEYDWKEVSGVDNIKDYKYDFDLELNTEDMTLSGTLDFTYYNNNDIPMNELVFYLYANSHEKEEYYAIEEGYFDYGYPNGFSKGKIDIHSVEILGGGSYEVTGSQNHLLIVNLDNEIAKDKSTELKIRYTVTIPNSYGRFGYGEETISVVNCNPIMAVYDKDTGYYDYDYNNIGDPFFSECADYSSKITVPQGYIIAPTGTITDEISAGGKITYVVYGENRRDFGFVASDDFNVVTEIINGIEINSYSYSSQKVNKRALEIAVDSIEAFSTAFGEYPYETLNVVETNFFIGGMEYPGMVMIDGSYYNSYGEDTMEMIIAHEVAHQWWYAQVGNDQIADPWLDDALATFSERVYYEHVYPLDYEDMIYKNADSDFIRYNRYYDKQNTRIDLNTLDYGDEYSLVVYGFGGWMINDLREELGEETFYEAMNNYLENNLFQIATREDLEAAIEEVTGEDITQWFDENLQVQVGY